MRNRFLIVVSFFALLSNCAFGTISIVNNDSNAGHVTCNSSASNCLTPTIDTSGASLYVAIVMSDASGTLSVTSFVNDQTNNATSFDIFTCLTPQTTGGGVAATMRICYMPGPTPTPVADFQVNAGGGSVWMEVSIWKGTDPTSAVIDVSNGSNSGASSVSSIAPGSTGTLAGAGELVISGWLSNWHPGTGLAVTASMTILDSLIANAQPNAAGAYIVAGSTTALNPTWSITSAVGQMGAVIAAFKPVTGTPIEVFNATSGVTTSPHQGPTIVANPITVVGGNLMVCGVGANASAQPTGVADANNTYTDTGNHLSFSDGSNTYEMSIWYKANLTSGSGLTPTATFGSTITGFMICHQYANMATSGVLDSPSLVSGSQTSTGTSVTSASFSTASANEAIFTFAMVATAGWGKETFTKGTNLTLRMLDYCTALCTGTIYGDIWQSSAVQDWFPDATETGVTAAISYTTNISVAADAGIVVAAFKGLGGTVLRRRAQVINQ